ncbi:MAG TPA: hypothetical protein VN936_11550, partial [Candidatus Acidoferrum sp.]|nr:hypothetical protein [Candidatus Acidoferrum sp.]
MRAVLRENARIENQRLAFKPRVSAERQPAAAVQRAHYRAFGRNSEHSLTMFEAIEKTNQIAIRFEVFHSQRALPHRR